MANEEHLKILKEGVWKWNKWRVENPGVKPDLSGLKMELSNLNIPGINFSEANLSGARLHWSNLSGSYMSYPFQTDDGGILDSLEYTGANLRKANFNGCSLMGVNLHYADLTEANFSEADLNGVDLAHCILDKSNFWQCKIYQTYFCQTDLSTCVGLDTVIAGRSCSIDFQTLRASRNLPKSFLLKIGLPELYIDYLPDFYQPEGIRYYPAFLSHSWANKPFARKLYEALIARGVNVFFDEKKMKPGDDIFTSLSRGIELYDKTILVCSEESLNSWWVDQELELVFEKERALQKEVGEKIGLLIPIRIDNHIDTWSSGKRMAIKQRIIGDFSNWQDDAAFELALNDLIHALNADRPEIKPVSHLPRKPK